MPDKEGHGKQERKKEEKIMMTKLLCTLNPVYGWAIVLLLAIASIAVAIDLSKIATYVWKNRKDY